MKININDFNGYESKTTLASVFDPVKKINNELSLFFWIEEDGIDFTEYRILNHGKFVFRSYNFKQAVKAYNKLF